MKINKTKHKNGKDCVIFLCCPIGGVGEPATVRVARTTAGLCQTYTCQRCGEIWNLRWHKYSVTATRKRMINLHHEIEAFETLQKKCYNVVKYRVSAIAHNKFAVDCYTQKNKFIKRKLGYNMVDQKKTLGFINSHTKYIRDKFCGFLEEKS